ncbi:MAG: hypothetical protein IJD40_11610 [Lachnospiraceae bacterium]|nr:hypothetical protein [Lachnospiraceae bacterium]
MKLLSTKKLSILFVMCLAVSFVLTGCTPKFDASGYIKSCLDANTKGEFEAYAEITGATVEEVESLYNQAIEAEMASIAPYVNDEQKENFRQLFIDMYKSFKYEVGEATLNDDKSYTVPVTTYKLMIFDGILAEGETYLTDFAQAEIDAGRTPTQEQLEEEAMNFMYDAMKKNLDALTYAEPVTTDIIISPTKNGSQIVYSADPSALQGLIESLVDLENAQ